MQPFEVISINFPGGGQLARVEMIRFPHGVIVLLVHIRTKWKADSQRLHLTSLNFGLDLTQNHGCPSSE